MKPIKKQTYFVNPLVDFACIGGLSLLTLGVFSLVFGSALNNDAARLSVVMSYVINWPHFSATAYRLFRRKETVLEYPLTSVLMPVLVICGVLLSFARPETIAPYFVKLFLIWSPYHFSGQTFGLSQLYARRSGFMLESWERKAFSFFIFSTFLAPSMSAEVGTRTSQYYDIMYPSLNIPPLLAQLPWVLMYASASVIVLAGVWRIANRKGFYPLIVLLPLITQWTWFVIGWRCASFYYFVPMFHSLQYLLIAWAMQLGERKGELTKLLPRFTLKETFWWSAVNIVGGYMLFEGFPKLASWTGVPLPLATGIIISGVQIHHFIVDGVIWKLRNPRVSAALMGSVSDFIPQRKAA